MNRCFNPLSTVYLFLCAASPLLSATPAISSVMNSATNIVQSLPNSAIAPGSIFVVKGTGLGPLSLSVSQTPFQSTTLNGTSVAVTVGGTTVSCLMYYTSDGQIAALLASNTPTGSGTIKVTYNGQSSAAAPIGVAANNLGIFTVDSSGSTGDSVAIVTYPDYSLVSSVKAPNCGGPNTTCGAANPGDTLILWATGLGRITGDDASGAGLGQNMPNVPLKLWIGGVQANVSYQGRSGCCIGEDQIVFTVPDDAPTGCAVPMVVEITTNITEVSNSAMMPIARGSRSCALSDIAAGSIDASLLSGTVPFGEVEVDHLLNDSGSGFNDTASFNFLTFTIPAAVQPFAGTYLDHIPVGTCITQNSVRPGDPPAFTNLVPLDGGSRFTVTGPKGSQTVTAATGDNVSLSTAGTFLVPGDYTISGGGGKDVGAFSVNVNLPALPTLTSPANPGSLSVNRTKGLTITWNPTGASSHVEIQLRSAAAGNSFAMISCKAPVSAGTFTIPSYLLFALPNGNGTNFNFQTGDGPAGPASISLFSASGLASGIAQTFADGISFGGFNIAN
ncbi:MAG: hypothetical protein LAP38_20805 [Acidobacteriia bacterium]|nr:hypothetical protein [Terriglobia bacterium]